MATVGWLYSNKSKAQEALHNQDMNEVMTQKENKDNTHMSIIAQEITKFQFKSCYYLNKSCIQVWNGINLTLLDPE